MNRKSADRIIVKSNDRMKLVIDWYMDNRNWIDRENFKAPMESGVVELQEEMLEFTFENIGDIVEIAIYPTLEPNIPASIVFDYNPMTQRITNRRVAPTLPEAKRQALNLVMLYDRTDQKEALKYHALMQFMVYYCEAVEVEERSVKPTPRAKSHKRKVRRKPQPLIRRAYVISEFGSATFKKPDGVKRPYTKPEHEVNVRGYMRRYKNGKMVWVKPCVKYKGKTASHKEYEL